MATHRVQSLVLCGWLVGGLLSMQTELSHAQARATAPASTEREVIRAKLAEKGAKLLPAQMTEIDN